MKTTSLIILLQFAFTCNYAQSINFNQAVKLYSTWMETKGQDHGPISSQLKMIDPKWAIEPVKPIIEEHSKYFLWESPLANKEKQQFAVYLEEDEKTVKYSLTYAFFSKSQFDIFEKAIRADDPKATRFINTSKSETEISSRGSSKSVLLREFPVEDSGEGKFAYTLEIFSKYINK